MFALISYGRAQRGLRPPTRLAYIAKGIIQTWNGTQWIDYEGTLTDIIVYKDWGLREPAATEVKRAKKRLTPVA